MRLLWILSILFVPVYQVSKPNCLIDNPEVLDAHFNLRNTYKSYRDIIGTHVKNQVALFSTRFKRAHLFSSLPAGMTDFVQKALSLNSNQTNKKLQLFLYGNTPENRSDIIQVIQEHKEDYQTIRNINLGPGRPIAGLYLPKVLLTYKEKLKAIMKVFGPKQISSLPIGYLFHDCLTVLKTHRAKKLLIRLQFINCVIHPDAKPSPEISADTVIRKCDRLRRISISRGLSIEIMCTVGFPSFGTTSTGIVGSLPHFQRFWCRIVREVSGNQSHPKIILRSAFDEPPSEYEEDPSYPHDGKFHGGWWRRRETTSYATSSFVEKVEELEGHWKPENCTEECDTCAFHEECCAGRFCIIDDSFQPFVQGQPPKVCQLVRTTCAPRPPSPLLLQTTPSIFAVYTLKSYKYDSQKLDSNTSDPSNLESLVSESPIFHSTAKSITLSPNLSGSFLFLYVMFWCLDF